MFVWVSSSSLFLFLMFYYFHFHSASSLLWSRSRQKSQIHTVSPFLLECILTLAAAFGHRTLFDDDSFLQHSMVGSSFFPPFSGNSSVSSSNFHGAKVQAWVISIVVIVVILAVLTYFVPLVHRRFTLKHHMKGIMSNKLNIQIYEPSFKPGRKNINLLHQVPQVTIFSS